MTCSGCWASPARSSRPTPGRRCGRPSRASPTPCRATRRWRSSCWALSCPPAASSTCRPPTCRRPTARPTTSRPAGLDLAEIVSGIAEHGAKEVVAIVDECGGGEAQPEVRRGAEHAARRRLAPSWCTACRGREGEPVAGVASARQDLLPLMREPGLDFLQLYGRLKSRLAGTNDGLAATLGPVARLRVLAGRLSSPKLPVECNRVDASAGAEALRRAPSLAPAVGACERAAATYDFSPLFKEKLAAAREQLAFQKAAAGCGGWTRRLTSTPTPNGAYRFAVSRTHASACERERQPAPQPVPPSPAAAQEAPGRRSYVVEPPKRRLASRSGSIMTGTATRRATTSAASPRCIRRCSPSARAR